VWERPLGPSSMSPEFSERALTTSGTARLAVGCRLQGPWVPGVAVNVSQTITINAPPAAVFGWIEDPGKAVAWMTNVSHTQVLHEEPGRVGTTFQETVADAAGSLTIKGVITAFQPNRRIDFHLESRANVVDVCYIVAGDSAGAGARVDVKATIRWKFPINLLTTLQAGKLKRRVEAELASDLSRLKELCEQSRR